MTLDQRDGSAGLRSLRGAVGATLAFTMVALIALGVGWAVLFQRTSKSSAVRDAGQYGSLSGQAALAPFITDDLLAGNTEAIEKISTAGRALMTLGGAAHVKIWTVDGRVVWSDEAELIGRTFTFDEAEQRVLKGNGVLASISNLDDEENKFEIASGEKELLQVYFGTKTPTGTPVVVETYYPTNLINARAADQRRSFLPLLLGGLVLVVIAQVPLARTMNRRLKTLQTEREHLLERVITASDLERRRIAAEVHDGAVQELIGITFSLSAAADEAPPTMAERLNGLAIATRHTVRSLRSLLNSIYPVEVPEVGWAAGLDPIISALRQRGVMVNVKVPEVRLSPANELLLLRVGREALRNVDAHARASQVTISMTKSGNAVKLLIADNGVGFDKEMAESQRQVGHLGLQLLRDLSEDMGAVLVVDSTPGSGTTVHLELEENR
ncbi:MAG TPA: ATP-binding protein [Ilumatobacteraceae bacterium]|jgi:signal transduction histidine kinase|nr:ATP-binding protein [Ilumatobacteraceae bacterium]